MKTSNFFPIVLALLLSALIINFLVAASHTKSHSLESIKAGLERAYFEGQKDAINGDVRIKLNSDSVYVWTKSPWNDGMRYSFVPTKEDTYK